jgi:uncharacterized damage-inducible protein DinB
MRLLALSAFAFAGLWAQTQAPTVARIYDSQLSGIERELVPLVEALPADKMSFAPTQGEFKGVRTFAQQATHTATVIYEVCSALLEEKNPIEPGADDNGPATLKTKEDVVKYVKDAFAYGHKAMQTLTAENFTGQIKSPWGPNKMSRASLASIAVSHSFDHYGQMVVYARMNGIIPPASRR